MNILFAFYSIRKTKYVVGNCMKFGGGSKHNKLAENSALVALLYFIHLARIMRPAYVAVRIARFF